MKKLCLPACVVFLVAAASAFAEPYWYAYEGNDFPESNGEWIYTPDDPPAQRWLSDGQLYVDSRVGTPIRDNYLLARDYSLDPGPGETFIMRWRYRVEDVEGWAAPGILFTSDEQYAVGFLASEDRLWSFYGSSIYVDFEPGVAHDFELRSSDMRNYTLFLDGELALTGTFFESLFSAEVAWGDLSSAGSLVAWDYVAVGVVPEPSSLAALLTAATLRRCLR